MAGRNTVVYGIYSGRPQLEQAIGGLLADGVREEEISVVGGEQATTSAPAGAGAGGAVGGLVGETVGLLGGIGAGVIRGLKPLVSEVGGLVGTLLGLGVPEHAAPRYEGRIRQGATFVVVHGIDAESARRAHALLERTGAEDIGSAGGSS